MDGDIGVAFAGVGDNILRTNDRDALYSCFIDYFDCEEIVI